MEKILNSFKNKAIGYFIVAADALLAIILAIIFFATYGKAMANNAASNVPETVGIFLIAGAIIEVVVLIVPQYRFIHIIAIVMFSLALFKEVLLIPNLLADWINNVFYQGGNLGTNVFYLVFLLIILASAIAAGFIGFFKKEEDADAEMPIHTDNLMQVIKVATCGVVVLAAVLSSTLISITLKNSLNVAEEGFNPITKEVKEAAEAYDYSFNPEDVLIKEQEKYDYSGINSKVTATATRSGHNMVYYFEGAYAEGYQGDYSETYGNLYLWDDGLFGGRINSTDVRGYWFNSSLAEGKDADGNDIKDCVKMVSNVSKYESIITEEKEGFYERGAYVYLGFSWGTRSMILNGYKYYPEVALAIDTSSTGERFEVGETFDRESWVAVRILKNLKYSSVFKSSEVKWTLPTGMVDKNNVFQAPGEYEITAKWNKFEAKAKITVTGEAKAAE